MKKSRLILCITLSLFFLTPAFSQWERHIIDDKISTGVTVDTADFNGDALMDLLVVSFGTSDLIWYENKYPNWEKHYIDQDAYHITFAYAGDFDDNGTMDVAALIFGDKQMVWYENKDNNWVKHIIEEDTDGDVILVKDLNEDGATDIILAPYGGDLVWYENRFPEWEKHVLDAGTYTFSWVELADINDDGINDLVTTDYDGNVFLYQSGDKWVSCSKYTLFEHIDKLFMAVTGDVNADGKTDFIMGTGGPYLDGDEISWYENDFPSWKKHPIDTDNYGRNGYVNDVNNDGIKDIVAGGYEQNNIVWYEQEDTSWIKHEILTITGPRSFVLVDFDDDGYKDLVDAGEEELVLVRNPGIIALATSYEASPFCIKPVDDTLTVTVSLDNPDNHGMSVSATIIGTRIKFGDSFILFDDGMHSDEAPDDNIWGNTYITSDIGDDLFMVYPETHDSTRLDYEYEYPPLQFITYGPVNYDSYSFQSTLDTTNYPGESTKIWLHLKNNGPMQSAMDIKATLTSLDPLVTINEDIRNFNDIPAGESRISNSIFTITVDENHTVDTYFPVMVKIYSLDHLCWIDTIYLHVDNPNPGTDGIVTHEMNSFRIYPNPVNDIVTVESVYHDLESIEIISLSGQVLHQKEITGRNCKIDLSSLSNGIYFVNVRTDDYVKTEKIIKE